MLLPGMYENGTPYCHGPAFKIVADCLAGRSDIALRSYHKVMPDSPEHPSVVSGCEPYAFTNQYLGPDNGRAGESITGWITGTAGWMYRAVLEYMAGIQPDYSGFHIRPSLPSGWPAMEVERTLRGRRYWISIRRDAGSYTVLVNDRLVEDAFVPYL
jgi:cellobiose phosphorylase